MNDYKNEVPLYRLELVRDRSIPFTKVSPSKDAAIEIFHNLLDKSPVEKLAVMHVASNGDMVGVEIVASGQLEMVATSMNDIFRGAILACVPRIYMAHNHPGGNPQASGPDFKLTASAIQAATLLGIELIDHIVVSPDGSHYSIKENSNKMADELLRMELDKILSRPGSLDYRGYPRSGGGIPPLPNDIQALDELLLEMLSKAKKY